LFLGAVTTLACGKATSRSHADGTIERAAAASVPYADTTTTLDAPRLLVPVECPVDLGCVVRNFVDQDPGPGSCDFCGGRLAYDGHKGTDIRVPDGSKLVEGIVVLAAAGGTVARIRDGVADVSTRVGGRETVEGREAGNSVILDHGGGWETQYSHLRRASLRVAPGDRVLAGQPIALIGLSGDTEFLHLHLEIRHHGVAIDPYTFPSQESRYPISALMTQPPRNSPDTRFGTSPRDGDRLRSRGGAAYAGRVEGGTFDETAFFRAVATGGVRALLIGRRALIALGLPVLTADYDFWIHIDDAGTFNACLAPLGLVPSRSPDEARKVGRYVLENDERVDVLVARSVPTVDGVSVQFDDVWKRRRTLDLGAGATVAVPCLDDLILTKRFGSRPKDAQDIRMLELLRREGGGS
jgi:murein DD-endopeptidase MepM/ murein hydrolase activator NlpD